MEVNMKIIAKLTDKTVLGTANGLSKKPPRLTARAIVKNTRGEIAILYFKSNDLYSLPGGGIESGEYPIDALKREILEETGCTAKHIKELGIVEENQRLRAWYEKYGFVHTGTQKFDFFPFTCGYMRKQLFGDDA